jgi:hypothetical protein
MFWRVVFDLRPGDTTTVTATRTRTRANRCRSVATGRRCPAHGSHRELFALPLTLEAAGEILGPRCASAGRLDGVSSGSEVVLRDVSYAAA